MTDEQSPLRQSSRQIGDHVKRGFLCYVDHWQEWLLPMIVAAALAVLSLMCCVFPYFLILGPIACGLYGCALDTLRNRPVDKDLIQRGATRAGSSIAASVFISIVAMAPALLIYGAFFLLFAFFAILSPSAEMPPRPIATESRMLAPLPPIAENPAEGKAAADGASGSTHGSQLPGPPRRTAESSGFATLLIIPLVFLFYAAMFALIVLLWLWQLWLTTRTMFVFPLIVDRGLGFREALRQSWIETRVRFWELLAINFVAGLIAMLGVNAMYVGLLFTVPIAVTIVASVYEERFGVPSQENQQGAAEGDGPCPSAVQDGGL